MCSKYFRIGSASISCRIDQVLGVGLKGLAGEGLWVGLGMAINIVALLVGTRLLTTYLPVEEYGRLALGLSLVGVAVQVGATPISQIIVRFFSDREKKGELTHLLRRVALYLIVLLCAIAGIALIAALLLGQFAGESSAGFILLLALFAMMMSVNRMAIAINDALRERRWRAMTQGAFEFGRFAFAIVLIIWIASPKAEMALAGFAVAGIGVILVNLHSFRRRWPTTFFSKTKQKEAERGKEFGRHILPLVISNACIWVIMMVDRWLIQAWSGVEMVGGYAAVYQLSYMPMMLISSFLLILTTPVIYQWVGAEVNDADLGRVLKVNRFLAVVVLGFTLVGAMLLFAGHEYVARLLLGEAFRPYSWIFPWLVLAGGCFAAAQQLLLKWSCEMKFGALAAFWGLLAVVAATAYSAGLVLAGLQGLVAAVVGVNGLLLVVALVPTFNFTWVVRR